MFHRKRVLMVPAALLVAVAGSAFAACGGDDSSQAGGTASPTTAPASATVAPTNVPTTVPTAAPTATAAAAATIKTGNGGSLGTVLTDANGLTLYTFKSDEASPGKSVCNDSCAATWPPVVATSPATAASGITGTLTSIVRDDGAKQVAYNGKPLYRFAPDKAPGDVKGQGIGNVWFVATP